MKAIITRGLPGSGKTTYAEKWVEESPEKRAIVERDRIRETLLPGSSKARPEKGVEAVVNNIQEDTIRGMAKLGRDIIVSDTNLSRKFAKRVIKVLVECGYEVEIKDFLTPLDEILKREKVRNKVGEKVIRKKAKAFPLSVWWDFDKLLEEVIAESVFSSVKNNPTGIKTVVFDVDGTLASMEGRSPYDLSLVMFDSPNQNVINLTKMYHANGYKVVIFSGRDEKSREDTTKWLKEYGVEFDELHMRKAGDVRNDSIVKYEMVLELVKEHYVEMVFDDRDRVVSMWRKVFADQPTICAQVNYGKF